MLSASQQTAVLLHRQPLWLDAAEHALESAGVTALAKLTRPSSALAWIIEHSPSLLVVDLDASDDDLDGLACLEEACSHVPGLTTIVVGERSHPAELSSAARRALAATRSAAESRVLAPAA